MDEISNVSSGSAKDHVFPDLNCDDTSSAPTELESLCVNCEEMGTTRILLTRIPHYKDVILMSFHCDHCGYHNNEIQSGGKVQEQGLRLILSVNNEKHLNRQIVKSEYAGVSIPELSLEIPAGSQAGEITTVEGILSRVRESLAQGQAARKTVCSTQASQIEDFFQQVDMLKSGRLPFTLIIDDASGNSHIENPVPYQVDHQVKVIHYHRSLDQDKLLSLVPDDATESSGQHEGAAVWESSDALKNEVLHFPTNCSNCNAPAQTNMKFVDVPHFKEVVIMATNCDACGKRTSEVKSGGGIADTGTKITLFVSQPYDFRRDVLKSETCSLAIPELELEAGMGALGGRFTTVEGVLEAIKDELVDSSVLEGDSIEDKKRAKLEQFVAKLENMQKGNEPFHLVLDDCAGNSYIESLAGPDDRLKVEKYTRTFEQNESLGLNDMKVEGYGDSSTLPNNRAAVLVHNSN